MNKEVYRHILKNYGRNPGQWVGFLAEFIRKGVVRIYVVVIMAQVTTQVASGDIAGAKRSTLYYLISYVAVSIIGAAGEIISTRIEQVQYGQLMMSYYKKLVGKDLSFYRDNQTGYLASVFRQYLDNAIQLVRFFRGEAMGAFISLTFAPIILFIASPTLGLIAAAIVSIQLLYVIWSSAKAHTYRAITTEIYRKVTGEVSDEITNIVAFKSGGIEGQARSKIAGLMKQETTAFTMRRKLTVLLDLPRGILTAIGVSLAVYFIISRSAGADAQSLGLIVLTLTYMFQITRNVGALPELITIHDDLITKIYPTLHYLTGEYETIKDPVKPVPFKVLNGKINIDQIRFSYPSRSEKGTRIPVFDNLTIKIAGGEQVGIVGLSGAGKSTLANLLLRFDDIDSGSITIDGIDIRDVRQSELRQKIAYVPQEPLLFHRTIKENIAYYNPGADDEEVIRAAKAAHAHEFIEKLPDLYDTIVGERGVKLSGGQKQRVAIARAVLKKAPIMIFDEATSALDSESEQIIQRALPEILGKQTAIIVAHRLSTIAGLDRIIVMHDGQIIEEGTHEELLKLGGRYYSLWQKQTREFGNV